MLNYQQNPTTFNTTTSLIEHYYRGRAVFDSIHVAEIPRETDGPIRSVFPVVFANFGRQRIEAIPLIPGITLTDVNDIALTFLQSKIAEKLNSKLLKMDAFYTKSQRGNERQELLRADILQRQEPKQMILYNPLIAKAGTFILTQKGLNPVLPYFEIRKSIYDDSMVINSEPGYFDNIESVY